MSPDYLRYNDEYKYHSEALLNDKYEIYNDTVRKQATPAWVVEDMVALLPDDAFTLESKYLDLYSKSGIFLEVIRNRLMINKEHIEKFPDPKERFDYITNNQLYALVWDGDKDFGRNQLYLTCMAVLDNMKSFINIKPFYHDGRHIKDENGKLKFKEALHSEEYFKDMKFDVVVGNPPYNNDKYLDFVTVGHRLASKYSLWITPAKWQAKGGDKNEKFRQTIVPYMSKIVYYPDTFEIFDIREQEGITYYIIDNQTHTDKSIAVKCKANTSYNSNEIRNNVLYTLYGSNISSIMYKVKSQKYLDEIIGAKQSEYVSNTESGHTQGKYALYIGNKTDSYVDDADLRTKIDIDKYKITTSVMPVDVGFDKNGQMFGLSKTYIVPPNAVPKGSFPVLMKFDTLQESESFQSYCNCKLVRFLYLIGICGKTIAEEFWRYVPNQDKWDRIFTDNELYNKYGLEQHEIEIINSLIKDRN